MSGRQKRYFWPLALILVLASSAILLAYARRSSGSSSEKRVATIKHDAPRPQAAPTQSAIQHVRRARLGRQFHKLLDVLGNRLEHPGKERLTMEGTLNLKGGSGDTPFTLVNEFPDRLRLVRQGGGTVIFNGQRAAKAEGALDGAEEALLETLVNDTAEHFLQLQMSGSSARFLGPRFRLDDGTDANYAGPFYDIYQVADLVTVGSEPRGQTKLYYFNSETQVLERVRYQLARGGVTVNVETRLEGWQKVEGQQVPTRIARLENGQVVFQLAVTRAGLAPAAQDGTFKAPRD